MPPVLYAMNCHREFDQTFHGPDRAFIPMFKITTTQTTRLLYTLLTLTFAQYARAAEITLAWNASPSTSAAGY